MTKKVLLTFFVLFLLLCVTGLWLTLSTAGLHLAWRFAVPLAHSLADIEMKADTITGSLLGPIEVRNFHYRDPWVLVELDQGLIEWQPLQMLWARIKINSVSAKHVKVTLQDAVNADNASTEKLPTLLPMTVHIERADIKSGLFLLAQDSTPWAFSDIRTRVRVLGDRVTIEQLTTEAFGAHAEADGYISWHGSMPMALNAVISQSLPNSETLLSRIQAEGDLEDFKLHLITDAPYAGDLAMQWREVGAGYEVAFKGPMEPAPLLVALDLLPPEALTTGPLLVDALGVLDASGFEASHLQIKHGESQLDAKGRLDWADSTLSWTADADWQKLALPPWAPAVHSATGHATVSGTPAKGEARIDAAYSVDGQKPGQTRLHALWHDGVVDLQEGELAAGSSRIEAHGQVWPRANLDWSANSTNLGELWPTASGRIKGQGKLSGDWLAPRIQGNLDAQNLHMDSLHLDKLNAAADLDLEKESQGFLKLNATGLRLSDFDPANVDMNMTGQRSDHVIQLSVKAPQLTAKAQFSGKWAGGTSPWLGTLQTMNVHPSQTDIWQLEAPADIQLHGEKISLGKVCLKQGASQFCMQGSKQADQWQGEAKLVSLPLALLSDWLPPALKLQGVANGQAQVSGSSNQWQSLTVTSDAKARLSRTDIADELNLTLHGFSLVANPQLWNSELELQINESGLISADAAAEPVSSDWRSAKLRGALRLDMPKLKELALIAPEIEQLKGQIKGDIQATGTLAQPVFGGRLALEKGQLDLRDYGISLSPLTATISGKSDGSLNVDLQATSGGGELRAQGQVTPNWQKPDMQMTVKGEHFLASRTDEATVYVTPDLVISIRDRLIELSGKVDIPEATLKPGEQEAAVQTVSADQILVSDHQAETREALWKLKAMIRIILGEKVSFKGMGIDTRLTGQIDIRETPGNPTIGNGEIRLLDGSYEIYGQKLAIDTGRLIFANAPVMQPALDIKASRTPQPEINVGVKVRGLLDDPKITLFSTPSMRQSEQLSYLILGRPLEGNEGNPTLASAALALGLKRGDNYIKGLSDSLKVDDIGIETTPGQTAEQASLVVGKYLSPRLYVSYGAGLFEPLHKLRMRYRMTEHWTLTGESGTTQGADIMYTIER